VGPSGLGCPFIIVPKPVYVAVAESNNQFASKVRWLGKWREDDWKYYVGFGNGF
jgi:hypothetical protein